FHACVRQLSGIGFKILLDIIASSPEPIRFRELPYQFRERRSGASKLDSRVAWDYLMLLLDKRIGRFIPVRFVSFAIVGGAGVVMHFATLTLLYMLIGVNFVASQAVATVSAMVFNFAVNNVLTYYDVRFTGLRWFAGLLSFVLVCSVGAVANVGVADFLFHNHTYWALSAAAGILMSAVWNYAVTSIYTWKVR
ncbi:MAG: GtrA family protein, partial [Pseudomonadota bacterium]|nr:GtrA family protein [Pseudomonadota bacterium]